LGTFWDYAKADFALHEHFLSSSSSPLGESQEDNVAHGGPLWARRAAPIAALGGLAPELVSIGDVVAYLALTQLIAKR